MPVRPRQTIRLLWPPHKHTINSLPLAHPGTLEPEDWVLLGVAAIGVGHDHGDLFGSFNDDVAGLVLIAVGVTADTDGLGPAGDQPWNGVADDGFPEDGAAQDVTDGAIGTEPHFLEVEFDHTFFVGGDGGALDGHVVLQSGVGAVDGDLVVGLVAVLHAQVVVEALHVQVGEDQLVFDHLPDDTGHLVAVHFDHWFVNLDSLVGRNWKQKA